MAPSTTFYLRVILSLVLACTVFGHEKLRYFETLKVSDFSRRVKRSSDPDPNSDAHLTEIHVSTLGRKFHLFLKPTKVISHGFKAYAVSGTGRREEFHVDRGSILSGKIAGDESATANLGFDENGLVTANFITNDDTYIIEPAWRLLPPSENHTMVSYRRSDVKFEGADHGEHRITTCGIKEGWRNGGPLSREDMELHGLMTADSETDDHSRREKRQASPFLLSHTTCELMVVADYKFFESMGGYSRAATALYLIQTIQYVDSVYRKTQFDTTGGSMTGVGFQIGEMRIHTEATRGKQLQGRTHYNVQTEFWDSTLLLEAFSTDKYFKRFCLAHLFTYRKFSNGVLGLAYIASERQTAVGGLCSPWYSKYTNVKMTLNTGWSSSQNAGGHRLLSLQAWLVTTHGHNLGSEHDPETDECAPSEYDDGKYVMYTWAVDGYDKNNQVFSPCSKKYIYGVLKVKGYQCLIEGRGDGAFCGNGRIDEGETCDGGWDTKNGEDYCCDESCQLRPGKLCSPMNFGCCNTLCKPYDSEHVCQPAQTWACRGEVLCDGINKECPNITNVLTHDEDCIDDGKCRNGQCLNFCQLINPNLKPCVCAKDSGKACHRCCKTVNPSGKCESYNNTLLPDGRPCFQGLCKQGVCEKKRQDMVQRLFSIIEDITIDQVVAFMKSNIVGTTIVLSLIIWIPASCVVSYVDRKRDRKEKEKRNWMSRSNRTLFKEEDSALIRRVMEPRTPRAVARVNLDRPGRAPKEENPFIWPASTPSRIHGPDDETVV